MNDSRTDEKAPVLNYQKRYDQVSWHSQDTDFEVDPTIKGKGSAIDRLKTFCSRRNRKLTVLFIVIVVFLVILSGLIYLYYSKSIAAEIEYDQIVETNCGKVAGLSETVVTDNSVERTCSAFYGIPYARPPIDILRWRNPIPLSANKSYCWEGLLKPNANIPVCKQQSGDKAIGSEDCLFLNVWSPSLNSSAMLPVVVWIHGGSLMHGYSLEPGYSPDCEFSTSMNVVSVSINYRLNAFGFLSLEELWVDGESYGNYGIMDQIVALKWVRDNIKNFGGDPSSVTIIGQSSGGTAIYGLLASTLADGLFHKAVPISGSPLFNIDYKQAAKNNSVFLRNYNCQQSTLEERRRCLFNLTAQEIIAGIPLDSFPYWGMGDLTDLPTKERHDGALITVDGNVIDRPPQELSKLTFKSKRIPVLLGTTAQEIGFAPVQNFENKTWGDFLNYTRQRLDPFSSEIVPRIFDSLYSNISSESDNKYVDLQYLYETLATDIRVTCPNNYLANKMSKSDRHRIYRYVVTNQPSNFFNVIGHPTKNAAHMWDSTALFGFKFNRFGTYTPSAKDKAFMRTLRENFKHFILYGHLPDGDWITYPDATGVFTNDGVKVLRQQKYQEKQCDFWIQNGFLDYAWIN